MGSVERRCRKRARYFTLVTFDGSLTGGGATLQVGVRGLDESERKPIVAFWHTRWTTEDFQLLRIAPGDPGGQARLEAFTLLIAIKTWANTLHDTQGNLAILGDALGVLHDAVKLKAKDPVLNAVAAEVALVVAPLGLDIRAAHVWTQRNRICDMLSRVQEGQVVNEPALSQATRLSPQRPAGQILRSL